MRSELVNPVFTQVFKLWEVSVLIMAPNLTVESVQTELAGDCRVRTHVEMQFL